jgi:hypothetical protein
VHWGMDSVELGDWRGRVNRVHGGSNIRVGFETNELRLS